MIALIKCNFYHIGIGSTDVIIVFVTVMRKVPIHEPTTFKTSIVTNFLTDNTSNVGKQFSLHDVTSNIDENLYVPKLPVSSIFQNSFFNLES